MPIKMEGSMWCSIFRDWNIKCKWNIAEWKAVRFFLSFVFESLFNINIYIYEFKLLAYKIYLHWLHYISLSIYNISSLTLQLKLSDLMNIFKCVQLFQWWAKVSINKLRMRSIYTKTQSNGNGITFLDIRHFY